MQIKSSTTQYFIRNFPLSVALDRIAGFRKSVNSQSRQLVPRSSLRLPDEKKNLRTELTFGPEKGGKCDARQSEAREASYTRGASHTRENGGASFCACFRNNHVLYGNVSFGDYLLGI